jgi:hypothetical protein
MINNWEKMPVKKLAQYFPVRESGTFRHLYIPNPNAESLSLSNLFFSFVGFSIRLELLGENEVLLCWWQG